MIKKLIKKIVFFYYRTKKGLCISKGAEVSFSTIKQCGEGCRFLGTASVSSNVEMGKFTSINGPGTRVAARINKIKLGSFCSIASNVVIQEYYHKHDRITSYYINRNIFGEDVLFDIYSKGDIVVEDDVWIGSNSVILSGVTIGRGSIIGAGSVVTRNIPRYSIVGGNPAAFIKKRFCDETIAFLEGLRWWDWSIEDLKKNKELFNLTEQQLITRYSIN